MTDSPWQSPSGEDRPETPPAFVGFGGQPPESPVSFPEPGQPPVQSHPPTQGYFPAAGAPAAWTPPPKPGLVALRPMTLGTILGASFRVLRRNPRPTFGLALLIEGLVVLAAAGVIALVAFLSFSRLANASDSDAETIANGSVGLILISYLVPVTLAVFGSAIVEGVISLEVARATLGEKLSLAGLWRRARGRLGALIGWTWAVIGTALVVIVIVVALISVLVATGGSGGAVIGILLGILFYIGFLVVGAWLWIKLSFVPAALILERLTLGKAIARSWTLSRGYFWRTFGIMLLVAVILNAASSIVSIPLQLVGSVFITLLNPNGDPSAAIGGVVVIAAIAVFLTVVIGAVSIVVQAASTSLLYIDLRIRKEGLDLDLARFVEARQAGDDSVLDPYLPGGGGYPGTGGYLPGSGGVASTPGAWSNPAPQYAPPTHAPSAYEASPYGPPPTAPPAPPA